MTELSKKECVPCKGGVPPLQEEEYLPLLTQLTGWQVEQGHHLVKHYECQNYIEALELTNKCGAIAEEQGHHPVIELTWGKVKVTIWTHKIDGLTESDFILAAKYDKI